MRKERQDDRRTRVSQTDVPAHTLEQALRIPAAIAENYAFNAARPLDVAAALNLSPSSSFFKMLCGAAIAYGLTDGGYNAAEIVPTELSRRILEPTIEGDDEKAKREALLRPRVLREFLQKYERNRVPREDIALNVLAQMGVPRESCKRTYALILDSAKATGIFTDIKGVLYVNLQGAGTRPNGQVQSEEPSSSPTTEPFISDGTINGTSVASVGPSRQQSTEARSSSPNERRVFITHGKNRSFLDPLKELLLFGELEPRIAVERESVSQPVPEKVMAEMRECGAAIIHVDAEQRLFDAEAQQPHLVLNSNVLIEIGAAMALYGRRLILLVREGVSLPSNLQGLYQVRYSGEKLDGDVTIRLLKAIKDIKNHPLPGWGERRKESLVEVGTT